jgi:hypothetical protein
MRIRISNRPSPFISTTDDAMSNLSLLSNSDSEGKPSRWRHWWDRTVTPSSSFSPPRDNREGEDAVADDGQGEEGEEDE